MIWFTMILCVSIPKRARSVMSRSVSYSERNSGMHTHTKVVCDCARTLLKRELPHHVIQTGFLKQSTTCWADFSSDSIRPITSGVSPLLLSPITELAILKGSVHRHSTQRHTPAKIALQWYSSSG